MIVRSLPLERGKIFLTFDDGPDGYSTPQVLDLLKRKNVRATFYVIADKIPAERDLVERLLREGHRLGNHSLDHRYGIYFRGRSGMTAALRASVRALEKEGLTDLAGFRPPAGIITPPLVHAAQEMGIPLVLWNERFFDAVWPLREVSIRKSAAKLTDGSIVLLHDRQPPQRLSQFLRLLELYIDLLRARGFDLCALPRFENSAPLSSPNAAQTETVPF